MTSAHALEESPSTPINLARTTSIYESDSKMAGLRIFLRDLLAQHICEMQCCVKDTVAVTLRRELRDLSNFYENFPLQSPCQSRSPRQSVSPCQSQSPRQSSRHNSGEYEETALATDDSSNGSEVCMNDECLKLTSLLDATETVPLEMPMLPPCQRNAPLIASVASSARDLHRKAKLTSLLPQLAALAMKPDDKSKGDVVDSMRRRGKLHTHNFDGTSRQRLTALDGGATLMQPASSSVNPSPRSQLRRSITSDIGPIRPKLRVSTTSDGLRQSAAIELRRSATGDFRRSGSCRFGAHLRAESCEMRWERITSLALACLSKEFHWPRAHWKAAGQGTEPTQTLMCMRIVGDMLSFSPKSDGHEEARKAAAWQALDPHSPLRLSWLSLGVIFIAFDIVLLPLVACDMLDDDDISAYSIVAATYWTGDIVANLVTGVYVGANLERRFLQISVYYMRTWLALDIFLIVPYWAFLVIRCLRTANQNNNSGLGFQNLEFLKALGSLRFFRLLRVLKLRHSIVLVNDVINNPNLLLGLGILKIVALLFILTHYVACMWLWIGKSGWQDTLLPQDKIFTYFTSMQWALSQFQGTSDIVPTNTLETIYAVLFLIIAILVFCMFVSSLTNSIRQLQDLQTEANAMESAIKMYLSEHHISTNLSFRIKVFIKWKLGKRGREKRDKQLFPILPEALQKDLHTELRVPVMCRHHFFVVMRSSFPKIVCSIAHVATTTQYPSPYVPVFSPKEDCENMYFLVTGKMIFQQKENFCLVDSAARRPRHDRLNRVRGFPCFFSGSNNVSMQTSQKNDEPNHDDHALREISLRKGDVLSEAALWTAWKHQGDLRDDYDSQLLLLNSVSFVPIVMKDFQARTTTVMYARRFVVALNSYGKTFTDVIDYESFFDEDQDADDDEVFISQGDGRTCDNIDSKIIQAESRRPLRFSVPWSLFASPAGSGNANHVTPTRPVRMKTF